MKLLFAALIAFSLLATGCFHDYHHDRHRNGPGHSEDAPGHNKHHHHDRDDDHDHDD